MTAAGGGPGAKIVEVVGQDGSECGRRSPFGGLMDPTAISLATTAATTVVQLLATDAWEEAKGAVGTLWRRVHPQRAETVEAELVDARAEVLAARRAGEPEIEHDLVDEWRARLRRLLAADPAAAEMLRLLLEEVLNPALAGTGRVRGPLPVDTTDMRAIALDQGRVYQAGRDQHIHER
jgi:hypothetical protein